MRYWSCKKHNQSIWLDYISRDLIVGGGLKQLVTQDGLSGVTSNPTIFEHAIDSERADFQGTRKTPFR